MYFFVGKKGMLMKRLVLLMAALAVFSCGVEEVSRRPWRGEGEVWVRPGVNADSVALGGGVGYVTAVEYPDDYDWRADPQRGEVRCSLVVYADGVPMMKMPVGDKYEVSSDPDSHRMADGHLFTDYSSENETVIKKDGKVVLRYAGREVLRGMVEYGGDIYTLGDNRDGEGFAYRKNGKILFQRARGNSFGRLFRQNDSISFAFRESIRSVDGDFERYYYVLNREVTQVAVREDVKKVWDVVPYGDGICYLASLVGVKPPVLIMPDRMVALSMPAGSRMLDCGIEYAGSALFVEGLIDREGVEVTGAFWYEDGRSNVFADGMTVSSLCLDGDGINCVLNPALPYNKGGIYRSGELFIMPEGYSSVSSGTCAMVNGILHAGLSSLSGDDPLIWKDGRTETLKINGFITCVSAK